jgi:hypothetical protein
MPASKITLQVPRKRLTMNTVTAALSSCDWPRFSTFKNKNNFILISYSVATESDAAYLY